MTGPCRIRAPPTGWLLAGESQPVLAPACRRPFPWSLAAGANAPRSWRMSEGRANGDRIRPARLPRRHEHLVARRTLRSERRARLGHSACSPTPSARQRQSKCIAQGPAAGCPPAPGMARRYRRMGITTYRALGVSPEVTRQLLLASVRPRSTVSPSTAESASSR